MIVSAFSALSLAACRGDDAGAASAPPLPQVSVAQVVVKAVSQWDEYSGRIEATESVDLRPRVSGYIERVVYREGQEVKKGDVLFVIDARTYRAELARAEAQLARARSQAANSRSEAERAKMLVGQQAISTEVWEQRRAADESAQAEVLAAQAAVETARLNVEWTQVRAPISGRAGRAQFTAGNLVAAGDAASVLTTLMSLDKVYAYFDVDENAFLRYGQLARKGLRVSERDGKVPVQVGLANEDDFPHAGQVEFVDNRLDSGSGTIRMRAVLDNQGRMLTPGLYARVRLLGSSELNAVLIDDKAVLTDQDRKYVYVVDKDGKTQRRDVQLGGSADGLRIVDKGLAEGDRVIVNGWQKVFMPGMPVDATSVPMQAAAVPATASN
ncbi:MAG: efflux RND transporter periplasmic adaptor subunit [Aromatoleum sp.]|jgi:multidrug efflux system membrane fusion protein|nr:efflux RND transporter periplasmic adaptor subunit [Aromatoleum sp.]MDT3671301.1 efflux RND transporter periplasmic adaptor subunit [Aromatoleum sp.]